MSGVNVTADILIVGGGILGCSVAWHAVRLRPGARVVVVERQAGVGSQATSQAAALLTRARPNPAVMPLVERTYAAIAELGQELGQPLPLHAVGTMQVAASDAAMVALATIAAACAGHGLRCQRLEPEAIGALVPWLDPSAVRSGVLMPDDAFVDPYLLADAYAQAARRRGAQFRLGVVVRSIRVAGNRVAGLDTSDGVLHAPVVVLAAGAWAQQLAAPLGCALAMAPVRSQYWLTEPDAVFPRDHPVVILPDARMYARPELGALLFGLRAGTSISLDARDLPADLSGYAFADDADGWRSLEEGAAAVQRFFPALERIGIRSYVAGVSTYTPDGLFLAGAAPTLDGLGIDGLLVASGCCGAGIAASGGLGEMLAALAFDEQSPFAIAPFRLDRFGALAADEPFAAPFRARCEAARSGKTAG